MERSVSNEDGFTLVEVLVSLFIFALIAAGTMGAMFQTLAAKDRLDTADMTLTRLNQARSVIAADLNAMTLRDVRDGLGGWEDTRATTDGEALFTFTRTGRSNPADAPRGDLQRVSYAFRDGQFIRTALAHENPHEIAPGRSRVLLDGLADAEIAWLLRSNNQTQRLQSWRVPRSAAGDFPPVRALSLMLTSSDGTVTEHLFELGL